MSISNPHDVIFKQTESHIENAVDYIKGTCPVELVKNLDFTTLCLDETSYTTEELKEKQEPQKEKPPITRAA